MPRGDDTSHHDDDGCCGFGGLAAPIFFGCLPAPSSHLVSFTLLGFGVLGLGVAALPAGKKDPAASNALPWNMSLRFRAWRFTGSYKWGYK